MILMSRENRSFKIIKTRTTYIITIVVGEYLEKNLLCNSFQSWNDICRFNPRSTGVSYTRYILLSCGDEVALLQAVYHTGPIADGMDADNLKVIRTICQMSPPKTGIIQLTLQLSLMLSCTKKEYSMMHSVPSLTLIMEFWLLVMDLPRTGKISGLWRTGYTMQKYRQIVWTMYVAIGQAYFKFIQKLRLFLAGALSGG